MQTFQRQQFNQLWITLTSNEVLGVLDFDYIEDYFGNDGQLTLHRISDDSRTPVLMNSLPLETPETNNDVFTGQIDLSTVENGLYRLEGAVRDISGNVTVLSASLVREGPSILFEINITNQQVTVSFPVPVTIQMGLLVSTHLQPRIVIVELPIKKALVSNTKITKSSNFAVSIVKYLVFNTSIQKGVVSNPSIEKSLQVEANIDILQ